jgi:hypothetical protein
LRADMVDAKSWDRSAAVHQVEEFLRKEVVG